MSSKQTIPIRVDVDFKEDMKRISEIRFQKGLAKFNPKELGMSEMTRLLRKTIGYRMSLEELKTKPKKR